MSQDVQSASAARSPGAQLVLAAVVWSLVLLVLAATLPVEIDNNYTKPGIQPQYSLVHINGLGVLWLVAIPLVLSLSVGALLLLQAHGVWRSAWYLAAVLSGGLTVAGLVGTVTILIGVFVVPSGALLLAACVSRRARRRPLPGWYGDPWSGDARRYWNGRSWTGWVY